MRMLGSGPASDSAGREEAHDNYYFDSPAFDLVQGRGMLRLRSKGRVILGFKKGGERLGEAGVFDSIEIECEVSRELFEAAISTPSILFEQDLGPIRALKRHYGKLDLGLVGSLNTVRRLRTLGDFLLELDEVTYADGGKSHEVEIETEDPEGARRVLLRQFADLSVKATPQHLTKLQGMLSRAGTEIPGLPDAP